MRIIYFVIILLFGIPPVYTAGSNRTIKSQRQLETPKSLNMYSNTGEHTGFTKNSSSAHSVLMNNPRSWFLQRFHDQYLQKNENQDVYKNAYITHGHPAIHTVDSEIARLEWSRIYRSGYLPGDDNAVSILTDADGNSFIAGTVTSPTTGVDIIVIKYDTSGQLIWCTLYDAGFGLDDVFTEMALDDAGGLYIAGNSFNSFSAFDFTLVKYNVSGQKLWDVHYNGSDNNDDRINGLATGPMGSVAVSGVTESADTQTDWMTIVYDADGDLVWSALYDSPEHRDDSANDLVCDKMGNVFVTGYSTRADGRFDILTTKYDTSGEEVWLERFEHTDYSVSKAYWIAMDEVGNIYVSGDILDENYSNDFVILKYASDGFLQWSHTFNGTGNDNDFISDFIVKPSGTVYVTGYSREAVTGIDFVTIEYNTEGEAQWIARFNHDAESYDRATAMATDSLGNVYVTGITDIQSDEQRNTAFVTLCYDINGTLQWSTLYEGEVNEDEWATDIAIDADHQIIVTGTGGTYLGGNIITLKYKYDSSGQWVQRYDGEGSGEDWLQAMAVDEAGCVYIAANSRGENYDFDFALIKFDAEGNSVWSSRYDGTEHFDDIPTSLTVDMTGNIYVAGYTTDPDTNADYTLLKYNSEGALQWIKNYNGTGNVDDYAWAVQADDQGNVYISGSSWGATSGPDITTIKYNALGALLWVKNFNGAANDWDIPIAFHVDGVGNVYVAGTSRNSHGNDDMIIIKYNPSGEEQWNTNYNGDANGDDVAQAMTIDRDGMIYIAGSSYNGTGEFDIVTMKINSAGEKIWSSLFDGFMSNDDYAGDITIDGIGNVYVVGTSEIADYDYEFVTIQYDAEGTQKWISHQQGPGFSGAWANKIERDDDDNIYITGVKHGGDQWMNFITAKYDNQGVKQWLAIHKATGSFENNHSLIALDKVKNVFVCGTSTGYDSRWTGLMMLKYSQQNVHVLDKPKVLLENRLAQNYPNPFNASTVISYILEKPGHVSLNVYNLLGEKVATLREAYQIAGSYQVLWNPLNCPSGIYFYKLQTNEVMETKKLIVIN